MRFAAIAAMIAKSSMMTMDMKYALIVYSKNNQWRDMMRLKTFVLCFIIALLLLCLALVYPVRSGAQESMFAGTWTITYSDCHGQVTIYEDCKIQDVRDNYVLFKVAGRRVHMIPIITGCSSIKFVRERG